MGGEDLYTVATILGHRSLEMTQRYSHLAPGHLRAAIRHVDLERRGKGKKPDREAGKPAEVVALEVVRRDMEALSVEPPPVGVTVGKFIRRGLGLNYMVNLLVREALESNGFNQVHTARELKVSNVTLLQRMKQYSIPKVWPEHLPLQVRTYPRGTTIRQVAETAIRMVLEVNGFDRLASRRALGITATSLSSRIARYKICPPKADGISDDLPQNVHLLFTTGFVGGAGAGEDAPDPPVSNTEYCRGPAPAPHVLSPHRRD